MAKKVKKKIRKSVKTVRSSPFHIYWTKENYYYLFSGIILSIIGFYLLGLGNWDSTESLFLAPIILFIAFVILFPLAIITRKGKITGIKTSHTEGESVAAGQSKG
ncbi:MAG: hypothetical protein Kow0098_11210 [Ignavibacteriaceae bacterium]